MGFNLLQGTFDFGEIEEENQAEELKNESLGFSDEEVGELMPDWKEKSAGKNEGSGDRALENYKQAKAFEEEQRELREYQEDTEDEQEENEGYSDAELEAMLMDGEEQDNEEWDGQENEGYSDEELEAMLMDGEEQDNEEWDEQGNEEQHIELESLSESQDENNLDDDEYYLSMIDDSEGEEEEIEPEEKEQEPEEKEQKPEEKELEEGISSSTDEYTDEYFEYILEEIDGDEEDELEPEEDDYTDDDFESILEEIDGEEEELEPEEDDFEEMLEDGIGTDEEEELEPEEDDYTDDDFESILEEIDGEEEELEPEEDDYTDDDFEKMLEEGIGTDEEPENTEQTSSNVDNNFLDKELKNLQVEAKEKGSGGKAASNGVREVYRDTAEHTRETNESASANTYTTPGIQSNINEKDHPENKSNDFLISDERRDMLFYIKQLELEKSMLEQKIEVERLKNQINTGGQNNENKNDTGGTVGSGGNTDDSTNKAVQHKSSLHGVVKKPSKKLISISDFDKMNEDTLIKYVESYMRKQGVRNDLVDKKLLIEKFGAGNVKRLISKNMLIPFKNGFSLGV